MNLRKIFSKPITQSYSDLSEDDVNDIKDLFQEYSDKWSRKLGIEWKYDSVDHILGLSIYGIVSGDGINQYKDIVKDLIKYCARLEKFGFKCNRGVKNLISLTAAHIYVNIYKPNSIQESNVFEPLSNPDLEDLEDYLQEIFDTYAIHKRPDNESDAEDLYASGGSYYWVSHPKFDYITLEKLGYKKSRVIDAIIKAKPNIEKRLKREIIIENSPITTDWLGISIKKFHWDDAKKRQQNESTKFPKWVSPKEKLYFAISEIEANDTKKRYNTIELTDEEIRFLKAKLYLPKEAKMNKFRSVPLHSRFGIEILNSQGKWVFKINKLQDEWFICYYNMGIIENSGGNNIEVFKCDQMDGLLQCLKYFINKRHVSFDYVPPRNSWSDSKKKNTWAYTPWYMK